MARGNRPPLGVPPLIPHALNPVHQLRVMGRLIRRRASRPGTAPGTLVRPPGPAPAEKPRLTLMAYSQESVSESCPISPEDALPFPGGAVIGWLNVEGIHEVELIRELGERLAIHPLVLEDIVSLGQRPKVEDHGGYLYIVLPMLSLDPNSASVREEQISLILGGDYVLTFQERAGDNFDPVRERIRNGARVREKAADYLAYALVDAVVDHYFTVLEAIGDTAEALETEVVENPGRNTMHHLHALKREMLVVRRAVWPVRDMVNNLLRSESALITEPTRVYLRDVYDHTIRIIDTVEVLRDVIGGIIDLYLSSLSNRTNEVMKTLTIMATIFIPLTFIAGVYGMNFEYMPELEWRWGYPVLLGLMAAVAMAMVWMFRRRGWI